MTVDSFTVATDRIGPRRYWIVRIHPDVEHLRQAASRHRPHPDPAWWDECCGCCHPARDPLPANGYAGIIRYAQGWLTSEIVAHELVHAAVATYRMNVHADVRLNRGCGHREEQLAYIYGELYADLARRLTR